MDDETYYATFAEWAASRPPSIQRLIQEFPHRTCFIIDGERRYLLGYGEAEDEEDHALILTPVNPAEDYKAACAAQVRVCAKHMRKT